MGEGWLSSVVCWCEPSDILVSCVCGLLIFGVRSPTGRTYGAFHWLLKSDTVDRELVMVITILRIELYSKRAAWKLVLGADCLAAVHVNSSVLCEQV